MDNLNEIKQLQKIAGLLMENDDYDESSNSESDDTDAMGGINETGGGKEQLMQKGLTALKNMMANTRTNKELSQNTRIGYINALKEIEEVLYTLGSEGELEEDTYTQTYAEDGDENPQPEDEQYNENMYDLYRNPGDVNSAIEHYSDAELDSDNDTMPDEYSVPNPGLDADKKKPWKPRPFNNGKRDYSEPHKFGW